MDRVHTRMQSEASTAFPPFDVRACRTAIDVWSVGCIFAELLGRKPLFSGRNFLDTLRMVRGDSYMNLGVARRHCCPAPPSQQFDIIGTRPPEELAYIRSDDARRFLDSLPRKAPVPWATLYPSASSQALNLLDSMLQFHPSKRITVEAAMAHAYFDSVRKQYDAEPEPPVCSAALDCSFEYDASLGVAGASRAPTYR